MLGCRGGGKLWIIKVKVDAHSTYFNVSEYEDVSIINIMQVKLSCFLCHTVSYTWHQGCGQAVQGGLTCTNPPGYHRLNECTCST